MLNESMKQVRFLFLVFIFISIRNIAFGQVIEKAVALAPIYYSPNTCDREDAERLYNYIMNTMLNTQRIKVVERLFGQELISEEKKLNQGVDFVEGKVVDQGKQRGAEFILFIYVNTAKAYEVQREKTDKETKQKNLELVGYDCDLSLFARVINVENGQAVASQIITPSGNSTLGDATYTNEVSNRIVSGVLSGMSKKPQSPREAINKRMEELDPYMRKFIDEVFPVELQISMIREGLKNANKPNGGTEQQLIIIGGKSTGFKEGDKLIVKEIVPVEIGGKIYKDEVEIGKIKVLRISQDLVTCKFMEGEDSVLEKYNSKKNPLKVVYIPVKKLF